MKEMDGALTKLPIYKGRVYRNLIFDDFGGEEEYNRFLEKYIPSGWVYYPAYTSSSTKVDGYPVDGEYVVKLIIESETGHDVDGFGDNFENEVIHERGSTFLILDRQDETGVPVIYMQEVLDERKSQKPETDTDRDNLSPVQPVQTSDTDKIGLPGVPGQNSERNPFKPGGSQETVSGGPRDSVRGEGLSDPAPRRERTEWQLYLDEYDRETARASAAPQRTKWQAYLDEYDRLWAELMELASREPEQQDTVWKRYLREYDEAQRREEALKTIEILGYVPEEYAELFGVEPGTSWLVVRTYELRRKLRVQRQNTDEAFEWTQPGLKEDDAPENEVDNLPERGIIGNEDSGIPKSWGKLGEISDNDVLKGTNPNFRSDIPQYLNGTNDDYTYNCTNCVVAYSQRRKGYDVTAKAVGECGTLRSNNRLFSAWEGRAPTLAKGSGIEEITAYMNGCEDGALVAITIKMPGSVFSPSYGHAFVAEKIDGKIMFLNPQSGQRITRPEEFFEMVKVGSTRFMRVDDLPITDRGISACKEASK